MAKEALGRGLGALLGEMTEVYDNEMPNKGDVLDVPLKQVRPNPYQPRKTFDEKSLQELGDSIKHHGLLQPIVVVEDEVDGYILVAGERRLRASKLAKLKTIKAIVAKIDDEQMRQHALIENIQRDELNAIDLAHAYDELIKVHSMTHDELSSMVNKSRTHVTNSLRLLQLSKKAQKALVDGKISAGHAKILVPLDEKEQALMIDSIIGQKMNVRELEAVVKNSRNSTKVETSKPFIEELDLEDLKNKLESLGFKTTCKSNKCTLTFDSQSDVSTLLNYLN
ncbi:MAG: ParB/RepB/Spo0J family partition protein [Campylobacterota bacterium]|nr:ParB/RepB/Spo0J family partition protein [Campylobacterota bacterium]